MLNVIADTHTHTVACDHAFSTLAENVAQAKARGISFLCLTEHTPKLPGAPGILYFTCMRNLPRAMDGVVLLRGAEVNIMDYEGSVDLPDEVLDKLEWVIASYHSPCIKSEDIAAHTRGWMQIAQNPLIDVIGHCGDPRYHFEHAPVMKAFKECGKIVEINSHSLNARKGSGENCRKVAIACAELGIPVVVCSDAHYQLAIGEVNGAVAMLEEIGFPQELVLNADYERFSAVAMSVAED